MGDEHGLLAEKRAMDNIKPRKRLLRSPLRAIRAKCLECCGGSPKEVRLCSDESCALHPFRKGQNPFFRRRRSLSGMTARKRASSPSGKDFDKSSPKQIQLSLL